MNERKGLKAGPLFFTIPCAIARIPRDQLSFAAKLLYGRLRLYAHLPPEPEINEVQGPCYPGEDTLAREFGVSARYIREVLAELRDCGLISWQRTGRSNRYQIFPPTSFRVPDRKKDSALTGRKIPVRSDERFRPDRNESSDKKRLEKRGLTREAMREEAAKPVSINFGDSAFYRSEESD